MIPKQAIEKAIDAGWVYRQGLSFVRFEVHTMGHPWMKAWFGPEQSDIWQEVALEEIALDASFWSALGKALHWEMSPLYFHQALEGKYTEAGIKAHHFYDLILTGQDTAPFWDEVLTALECRRCAARICSAHQPPPTTAH